MKKRALSWLLALTMLLTLAPQTLPVWASAAGTDESESKTETKLSANTYSALGLSRDVNPEQQGLSKEKQPYGKAKVGNTAVSTMAGAFWIIFRWSLRTDRTSVGTAQTTSTVPWAFGGPDSKECTIKMVPVHVVLFLDIMERL